MDSVILRRVLSQFEADRLRDENLLLERRREIYDKIPEIRNIEADMRTTAAKIFGKTAIRKTILPSATGARYAPTSATSARSPASASSRHTPASRQKSCRAC